MNKKEFIYIDVLRALAILLVISVHCHQYVPNLSRYTIFIFNSGQFGVHLFFLVSAVTLSLSADQRKEAGWINFFIRRFFRIAPLYYLAIFFYSMPKIIDSNFFNLFIINPGKITTIGIAENIFFIHGFDSRYINNVVPGGWSISTEFIFYLIFPILYEFQKRMSIKKFIYLSLILITFAIIIKLSIISYLKETWNIDYNVVIYFSIINNLSVFLIGITTFKIIKKTNIKLIGYQIIFTICLFLSCFLLNIQKYSLKFIEFQNFIYIILISISFGILTIKLSQINFPKNFFINILSKIGKQSFSMYIIHCFVIKVIIVTADYYKIFFFKINLNTELILIILFLSSTMITYFLSKYTYEYIEKPGVNLGKKLTNAL